MAETPLRRIKSVQPRPGYRLAVAWERGPGVVADLSEMVSKGGVFKDLANYETFSAVRVGENNRIVEWPFPKDELGYPSIEIDADALFEMAQEQQTKIMAASMRKLLGALRQVAKPPLKFSKS